MSGLVGGENLFEIDAVEDIPVDDFVGAMERNTYACFRGLVSPAEMELAVARIRERFDSGRDHPTTGQGPDAVRTNFQKLNVGGEWRSANHDDARLFRAFYNPIWAEDVWGLRSAFSRLARVRNRIAHLPLDFATDRIEDNGLWTAARFHQYPSGGGFFRRHTDYVVKDLADESGTQFYQVVLTMSTKGQDFHQGGAFVDVGDERICLDDFAIPGDIIVYDGRTVHGVEDVDPRESLDLHTINGRLAGFATLFKKM